MATALVVSCGKSVAGHIASVSLGMAGMQCCGTHCNFLSGHGRDAMSWYAERTAVTISCNMQIEGADSPDARPLGTEFYTTLRSEADNEVNAATVASEEAEAEIGRSAVMRTGAQALLFSAL